MSCIATAASTGRHQTADSIKLAGGLNSKLYLPSPTGGESRKTCTGFTARENKIQDQRR
jgi:hypothetical protein